jgi:hypothetical protein
VAQGWKLGPFKTEVVPQVGVAYVPLASGLSVTDNVDGTVTISIRESVGAALHEAPDQRLDCYPAGRSENGRGLSST